MIACWLIGLCKKRFSVGILRNKNMLKWAVCFISWPNFRYIGFIDDWMIRNFLIGDFDSLFPDTLNNSSIGILHFSVTVSEIIEIISFEVIAIWPIKDSIAALLVIIIVAFVGFTVREGLAPLSKSMAQPVFKISDELTSIVPRIFTVTFRFAILIQTDILVAICKILFAVAVL